MNTAVINIKTEEETKIQAQQVARDIGVSLSSLVNAYLKQLIRTRRVEFDVREEPTAYLASVIKKAKKNRKQGKSSPVFKDSRDAVKWLEEHDV